MFMQADTVLDFTRLRFPEYREKGKFQVEPLDKGGSGRQYYRVTSGDSSMIFAKYTAQREENQHFVDIATFLLDCGLNVPEIYHHDPAEGLIWMEDLGGLDLWSFRDSNWEIRKALYFSALRQVARLHSEATRLLPSAKIKLQIEFNETLYLWEQEYFFEHAFQGIFGFSESQAREIASRPALQSLATRLASLPRCLIHRDFQSQNILIHEGTAWLIDFQGMRPGLPHYDLASLLYDPYVFLEDTERAELLAFYRSLLVENGGDAGENFQEVFLGCAAQRLMQALGAYGFLGLKCGKPGFLRHVPAAKRSLQQVLTQLEGLEDFVHLLNHSSENEL